MLRAFQRTGLEIHTIDNLSDPYRKVFQAKRVFKNVIVGKNYLRDREPLTLRSYARQIERRLSRIMPELVFSAGTIPIAYLRSDKPIVFWADATFDGMIDFYPEHTNLCNETIRNGHQMEQGALSNCRLAIYSSDWGAESAIANYTVDSKKIKVVPYGANLRQFPSTEQVQRAISSRGSGICRLLMVGVDWHRKGGEEALQVTSRLREHELNAELHIVGCIAPKAVPDYVRTYGYLSKRNREHNELLSRLFENSDLFILPSKAECAAVSVAEANAFGLPAMTTKVGGMGTVVKDGKNGRSFQPELFVELCSKYILELFSAKDRYYELCHSSFGEYRHRLNWDSAVLSVLKLLGAPGNRMGEA